MNTWFTQVKALQCSFASAAPVEQGISRVDRHVSLLFDELRAQAVGVAVPHAWTQRVLDVELFEPTRRGLLIELRFALNAMGQAEARASVWAEQRCRSECISSRPFNSVPGGDRLPMIHRGDGYLRLVLRRSTRPRQALRLNLIAEAACLGIEAEAGATLDSVDISMV